MRNVFLLFGVLIIYFATYAQNKICYVWVNGHWERPKANKQYHPDSLHCFEQGQLPPNRPQGGVGIRDTRNDANNLQTIIFQPKPVLKLFPKHIKGDREFAGNGPAVTGSVSIKISADQKHILANFKCLFAETVSDWTSATGDWTFSIFEAPPGRKIMKINSAAYSKATYTDINLLIDKPSVENGTLVNKFEFNGDTQNEDVGNDTNDDSYMSVYFNPVNLTLANLTDLSVPFTYNGYHIKCKETNMLLDVKGGEQTEKNSVWQYKSNLTASQRFVLVPNSGAFLIKANISNLYFTVKKPEILIGTSESSVFEPGHVFIQDKLYTAPRAAGEIMSGIVNLKNQLWNVIPAGEEATYYLESRAFPGMVLQSPNSQAGQQLLLAPKTNTDIQKWIIQRPKLNRDEANYGYGPLFVDAPGISSTITTWLAGLINNGNINGADVNVDNININILAPAHRSVGEMSIQAKPVKSYERLEGLVLEDECQVATVDFPTCHYTHDFTFQVKPNTSYQHLLATSLEEIDFQKNIEIEWETGLGQENSPQNPAIAANKAGNSFGFFTEGHKRNDLIWNWPSPGDSVYIEGMWIWERGHGLPHTEIHPPHFIATKRQLPVSFNIKNGSPVINNNPSDQFYGQRIDVFASADGSTHWNTKGLKSFAQVVDMNRQDYIFTVTCMFSKPVANAVLRWRIIKQKGNSFEANPVITLLADGKSVQINYPWKTRRVSNTAKVAQTIILYWEADATQGILESQRPAHFSLKLHSIKIHDNHEIVFDDGDINMFVNVGDKWLMLNEFATPASDPLSSGLGYALDDDNITITAPTLNFYLPEGKKFRLGSKGWENDHMNSRMGNILNEYSRSKTEIKPFLAEIFKVSGILDGQIEDDEVSEAIQYINSNTATKANVELNSKKGDYTLVYSIIKTN